MYFIRPGFDCDLFPLADLSPKIADAAAKHPTISKLEKGITAGKSTSSVPLDWSYHSIRSIQTGPFFTLRHGLTSILT